MKWASAIAEQPSLESALSECAASIREQLGEAPQLAVAFVSPHYQADYARVGPLLGDLLGSEHTFGCSGGGIIGAGVEVEQRPALSVTAATLPGVNIEAFHLEGDSLPDLDAGPDKWQDLLSVSQDQDPQFVLLADPFSFPVQNLIMGLDFAFPRAAKIGGLASGAQRPGTTPCFSTARCTEQEQSVWPCTATSWWTRWWPKGVAPLGKPCASLPATATSWQSLTESRR